MISKERLKEHIDKFPEEAFSMEELIERLLFIEQLEQRIELSEQTGKTLSEEELRNEIHKWPK